MEFSEALDVLDAFEREAVDYVLVGSMAMAVHRIPRATEAVDVFVDPAPENVERIKRALRSIFDDDEVDGIGPTDLKTFGVIRYGPPDRDYVIDLLSRLGEAFSFEDIEHQEVEMRGIRVRVATPSMLYRMKRDTTRAQDRADAEKIRSAFEISEED